MGGLPSGRVLWQRRRRSYQAGAPAVVQSPSLPEVQHQAVVLSLVLWRPQATRMTTNSKERSGSPHLRCMVAGCQKPLVRISFLLVLPFLLMLTLVPYASTDRSVIGRIQSISKNSHIRGSTRGPE